jgi:hypothetical protein
MRTKAVVTGLAVMVGLLLIGSLAAYAQWGDYGYGCMHGQGIGYANTAAPDAYQKFQSDTSAIKGALAQKQAELQTEYDNPSPDGNRIAKLEREVGDLHVKIHAAANKGGVNSSYMSGMTNCPMMAGSGMHQGHGMGHGMMTNCW